MAEHRTATVLKIRNGSAAHNPSLVRDESKIAPKGKPELPPWMELPPETAVIYASLVETFVLPGIHGKPDGALIAQLAREFAINGRANRSIETAGPLMRDARGQPKASPYVKIARDSNEKIIRLMNELGFSPSGRLRFAPPLDGRPMNFATWDDIDR